MGRLKSIQTSFTGGEISERLEGRVDIAKYFSSCSVLQNCVIHPHGGATRRSGFKFIAESGDSTKPVRVIPFEFSIDQTYILEFGDYYLRVYMDGAQVHSGGLPYEIATPYSADDIHKIQYCQSADMMYLVHSDYPPKKLGRSGHASWAFYDFDLAYGPWVYKPVEHELTSVALSAITGAGITLTASADLFTDGDIGRHLYLTRDEGDGSAVIVSVSSPRIAIADVVRDFAAPNGTTEWKMSEFGGSRGYPSAVTFHQQRLVLAGTKAAPQTVWLSKTDAYEDFETSDPIQDDDGCSFTLVADQVNSVHWLSSIKYLTAGTAGGEWIMAGSDGGAITPSSINASRHTTFGSFDTRPINMGNELAYIQRGGRKLRVFSYSLEADGYSATDLLLMSEHLTREIPIKSTVFMRNPDPVIWCIRDDGTLLGMTYLAEQQVASWHRHRTDGIFEDLAVIPNDTEGRDELWAVVKRTVNGVEKRYIEQMQEEFRGLSAGDGFFVDSGLIYEGEPAQLIYGLEHLEGKTVQIVADNAVYTEQVVTDGRITLAKPVSKAVVGLGYVTDICTMNIEGGTHGTAQGAKKRNNKAIFRIYKSLGMNVGTSFDKLEEVYFRDSSMSMRAAPLLYTGDKEVLLRSGWETEGRICVRQAQPLPLTLLAIVRHTAVDD